LKSHSVRRQHERLPSNGFIESAPPSSRHPLSLECALPIKR
jgi:hypothetical protein